MEDKNLKVVIDPNKKVNMDDDIFLPPVEEPTTDLKEVVKSVKESVGDING
jgi:hypothetical protein